ncbi:uncharacterized protein CLUP02_01489 [Colletotrichum lupini]|uniref:Uncharacterized protein n=1 Tax=Colletotrichum lupini TaxID=145971 RepID=A0A9Q8SE37_9PEZI|nr:uncharacterized protein CLUP02_01489 [Colletotrichum lupini]UQC74837.1 hypothetical protein CLUP02_01489 [Colletotrichum lupini]
MNDGQSIGQFDRPFRSTCDIDWPPASRVLDPQLSILFSFGSALLSLQASLPGCLLLVAPKDRQPMCPCQVPWLGRSLILPESHPVRDFSGVCRRMRLSFLILPLFEASRRHCLLSQIPSPYISTRRLDRSQVNTRRSKATANSIASPFAFGIASHLHLSKPLPRGKMPFARHGGLGRRPLPGIGASKTRGTSTISTSNVASLLLRAIFSSFSPGCSLAPKVATGPFGTNSMSPNVMDIGPSPIHLSTNHHHHPTRHLCFLSHCRRSPESRPLLAHFLSMDLERCVETISSAGNVRLSPDSSTVLARPRIHVNQTIKRTDGRWGWLSVLELRWSTLEAHVGWSSQNGTTGYLGHSTGVFQHSFSTRSLSSQEMHAADTQFAAEIIAVKDPGLLQGSICLEPPELYTQTNYPALSLLTLPPTAPRTPSTTAWNSINRRVNTQSSPVVRPLAGGFLTRLQRCTSISTAGSRQTMCIITIDGEVHVLYPMMLHMQEASLSTFHSELVAAISAIVLIFFNELLMRMWQADRGFRILDQISVAFGCWTIRCSKNAPNYKMHCTNMICNLEGRSFMILLIPWRIAN